MVHSNSKVEGAPGKKEEPVSKMRSFFRGLKNLFGFLAIILSWWTAILTAFLIGTSITILMYSDGYRPTTFTIEKLVYVKGGWQGSRSRPDRYWAEGTIADQTEKFKLGGYTKGIPQNQEDLEAQFKIGQELPVLYNPNVPEKLEVRVLYPEKDFHETWKRRQKQMIRTAYLPQGLAIFLCLICGILARKTKSAIGFSVASLFFVVMAWVFVWLKWVV